MTRIVSISREKLFDGFEFEVYSKTFQMDIENQTIDFTVDDFIDNDFYKFDKASTILKESNNFMVDSKTNTYENEEGLPLYYFSKNDYFILTAFGEFQPGRYMLFLEEAWKF